MARPLRLEYPGAVWHVVSRTDDRRGLFRDDEDREAFLKILEDVVMMFRWNLLGWVLLDREYQLLVETPDPTLSRGMRQLNGVYTQTFNRRHRRRGRLMRGRFRSVLVDRDEHLGDVAQAMFRAPVRDGVAKSPSQYRWSSFRSSAGLRKAPEWLSDESLLAAFGSGKRAQKQLRDAVTSGDDADSVWNEVRRQIFLGDEKFRDRAEKRSMATLRKSGSSRDGKRPSVARILRTTAEVFGVPETEIRRRKRGEARKIAAYIARREGAHRLADIAGPLGIKPWSASHLAASGAKAVESSPSLRRKVEEVVARL